MSVNPLRATVIIVAGGKGVRMGGHVPKQYMELRGRPVLWHTLQAFERAECISGVIVVVAADDMDYCQKAVLGGGDFPRCVLWLQVAVSALTLFRLASEKQRPRIRLSWSMMPCVPLFLSLLLSALSRRPIGGGQRCRRCPLRIR